MKKTEHMTKLFKALYDYGYRYLACGVTAAGKYHELKFCGGAYHHEEIQSF